MHKHKLSKKNAIAFAAFHITAAVSLFYLSVPVVLLTLVLLVQNLCLGIGASFHRYLVHRGYKAPKWVEYALATCGYCALQSSAISWVAIHREHHKESDTAKDPHSPMHGGGWWAHMDWMLHPDLKHKTFEYLMHWAPDMMRDPFYRFLHHIPWLPLAVEGGILAWAVGPIIMLQAVSLAIVLGWHWTWLVNSATHMWGYRNYQTKDQSRNNLLVAILTFGEGNHNNHHAHQVSARHGEKWYEPDMTYRLIWTLEQISRPLPERFKLVKSVTIWVPRDNKYRTSNLKPKASKAKSAKATA